MGRSGAEPGASAVRMGRTGAEPGASGRADGTPWVLRNFETAFQSLSPASVRKCFPGFRLCHRHFSQIFMKYEPVKRELKTNSEPPMIKS